MIRNIVFDIGDVLVTFDWKSYLNQFHFSEETNERIAKAVFLNEDWIASDLGYFDRKQLTQMFIENDPVLGAEIQDVFAGAGSAILEREYPVRWMEELKKRGFRLYYLSNYARWCYEDSRHILDKFIAKMEGGVFSYESHMLKPNINIYEELFRRYDLDPAECLFIDDRQANIDGAKTAGMEGILFTGEEEVWKALEEIGTVK